MFGASVYIIICSARNRLRVRLRRLREPRYLIGAIVGAAYSYFSFFARFRTRANVSRRQRWGRVRQPSSRRSPQRDRRYRSVPFRDDRGELDRRSDSGLLDFSDAEIQVFSLR
jgi:hypothetical protein